MENREYCIKVMKELIHREKAYESGKGDWDRLGVPVPFDTMTIRTFCKYYRIADTACWSKSEKKVTNRACDTEDDVKYYTNHNNIRLTHIHSVHQSGVEFVIS